MKKKKLTPGWMDTKSSSSSSSSSSSKFELREILKDGSDIPAATTRPTGGASIQDCEGLLLRDNEDDDPVIDLAMISSLATSQAPIQTD